MRIPATSDGSSTRNGFDARRGGQAAQPPLGVDRVRLLGDDDAVALADGTARGEDLARTVGHVLPRHLDEAERRDLDHVRLRPVALELQSQRLLDLRPVLRVRHVDEVDDDDPADVAQAQLTDDLLRASRLFFVIVSSSRAPELLPRAPTKRPVFTSMTVNASA